MDFSWIWMMGQRKRVPLMDQTRKVQSTCDDDNMPMGMLFDSQIQVQIQIPKGESQCDDKIIVALS